MRTKDKCFIDSNAFIYLLDATDVKKNKLALELFATRLNMFDTYISTQVIKEVSSVCLRRLKYSIDEVYRVVDLLNEHNVMDTSVETIKSGLEIVRNHSFSFYDSLIIASAIESNCSVLYSEDMNHGETIAGLKIINPFLN
jgi:predicted nucleic acid-binding protein